MPQTDAGRERLARLLCEGVGEGEARRDALHERWYGVLWDREVQRVCPTTRALDDAICANESDPRVRRETSLMAACRTLALPMWHLPTVEWCDHVVKLARTLGVARILEVGAGDGFTAKCIAEAAVRAGGRSLSVTATDPGHWHVGEARYPVEKLDARAAVAKYAETHDLVLWCWTPIGEAAAYEPDAIVADARVKFYLSVGEAHGGCTSHPEPDRFSPFLMEGPDACLRCLAQVTRCCTDYPSRYGDVYRHGRQYLYRGPRQRR